MQIEFQNLVLKASPCRRIHEKMSTSADLESIRYRFPAIRNRFRIDLESIQDRLRVDSGSIQDRFGTDSS